MGDSFLNAFSGIEIGEVDDNSFSPLSLEEIKEEPVEVIKEESFVEYKEFTRDDLRALTSKIKSDRILVDKKIALAEANKMNHDSIRERYDKAKNNADQCREHILRYDKIVTASQAESVAFTKNRLNFLSEAITKNLATVFPYDNLTCSVKYDTTRKNPVAYAELTNNNGHTLDPSDQASGLQKELIGFVSASSILECLGSSLFIFDEAFSMASDGNKPILGKMLEEFADKGVQMFIVSQSEKLYRDIKCRITHIEKDPITNSVSVTRVNDREGVDSIGNS